MEVLPLGTARPSYPYDPLPEWVTELRSHQVDAVRDVVDAFRNGADVVFLDAPVGAGKTLIAELVRREMGVDQGLYVCTDKQLQAQFLDDYDYARVLMGKANYRPTHAIGTVTCEDCTRATPKGAFNWCRDTKQCPYTIARNIALGRRDEAGMWTGGARVAVLNTSYALAAANF